MLLLTPRKWNGSSYNVILRRRKAKRIQALRDKLFKAADNRYLFTVSETNYLSEKLGISKELDGRDFRNAVNAKMASLFLNNTREEGVEEANAIVNEFARSQVFFVL